MKSAAIAMRHTYSEHVELYFARQAAASTFCLGKPGLAVAGTSLQYMLVRALLAAMLVAAVIAVTLHFLPLLPVVLAKFLGTTHLVASVATTSSTAVIIEGVVGLMKHQKAPTFDCQPGERDYSEIIRVEEKRDDKEMRNAI